MAPTKRSANLETRTRRLALAPGKKHTATISLGCYLIYHHNAQGKNGTWRARWRHPDTGKIQSSLLGAADDYLPADGVAILDWDQVTKKAGEWFRACARKAHQEATGEVISDGPYTVAQAIRDLIAHQEQEGHPTDTIESYARTRILPELGELDGARLSKPKLQAWLKALAESPRRRTGKRTSEDGAWGEGEKAPTADQLRARKVTANRILAILKRALNLAVEEGRLSPDATPWRDVKPFKGVIRSRVRFLSTEEQQRLVNACQEPFRSLVLAALFTGSRYAPLTRMRVGDFNPEAGTLWIEKDKGQGDTSRHVVLDEEAAAWFQEQVAGRGSQEILFQRTGVARVTRKNLGKAWAPQDQDWAMEQACKRAKITPLCFHELRHTYASMLVNRGVPLAYVAAQLGHKSTRMVERYYGHLAPTDMAKAIRKLTPKRHLTEAPKVQALKLKRA